MIFKNIVAYYVPTLSDYSSAALERAAGECVRACAEEAAAVRNDAELKAFRDRWMARKNGILTQINDLWLKGAPKEVKREVGQQVNEIKHRVKQTVDELRPQTHSYIGSGGSRTSGGAAIEVEPD